MFTAAGLKLPSARAAHELSMVLTAKGDCAEAARLHEQAAEAMRALHLPACEDDHHSGAAKVPSVAIQGHPPTGPH